jgi:hypothetical protein
MTNLWRRNNLKSEIRPFEFFVKGSAPAVL